MRNKTFVCLLLVTATSANAYPSVVTLSDKGLMSLDWHGDTNSAKVVDVRDVPGPGVEFDIHYPSRRTPENAMQYSSNKAGGAGKLANFDLGAYDSFGLAFTLVSVDGVKVPPAGGDLVVGAVVYAPSKSFSYRPEVITLREEGKNKATSITGLREEGISGLGFETHFLTYSDEWKDGTTLTLLIEPMPGAIQLPEQFDQVPARIKPAQAPSNAGPAPQKCGEYAAVSFNVPGANANVSPAMTYRQWLIGMALASGRSGIDALQQVDEILKRIDDVPVEPKGTAQLQHLDGGKTLILDLGGWVKMKLALIPAGEFLMGAPTSEQDRGLTEGPQHRVQISKPFYIGKHEVTQTQWEAVMGNNPSHVKGYGFPVEQVSWDDCRLFCEKLSKKTGKTVRLPTEAEWEYACRAGTTTRFNCGDDEFKLRDYAWVDDNSEGTTHKCGSKQPNQWGLYDMHGNVWEWCADWYGEKYYSESPLSDPTGPADGLFRVVRGGSWADLERMYLRCAYRNKNSPRRHNKYCGLRVVVASGF